MSETTELRGMPELVRRAEELDAADPLAGKRAEFVLDDVIYLDGNSLGALPAAVPGRMADAIARQWGELRIRSWDESGWWTAPERIGDRIAPLIGAAAGQVVVGDSTSVNVFKALVAAVRMAGDGRDEIVVDATTFPTDGYIARSAARMTGCTLRPVTPAEVPDVLDCARRSSCSTTRTTARAACTTCRRSPPPSTRRARWPSGTCATPRAPCRSGSTSTGWTWRSAAPTST
ncbi:Kynureninase [Streptomyces glaucescens]